MHVRAEHREAKKVDYVSQAAPELDAIPQTTQQAIEVFSIIDLNAAKKL
jgi:hypothetical protein